jgi:hypothetical protein
MRQFAKQLYSLPPDDERIGLQNGTQTKGLATAAHDYLEGQGYNIVIAPDAKTPYDQSVILDYRGDNEFAQELATALGLPASAISTTYGANVRYDVLVILGSDYHPR